MTQMRIYTLKDGSLLEFIKEWQEKIKPLREKIGFEINDAWVDKSNNKFIWIISLSDTKIWDDLELRYHNSEERKQMNPNPARNIISMKTYFIEEIN